MAIDHKADVKKYAPAATDAQVDKIIKHLGIAMKSTDAQLVSCSSKDELARVRDSWCKKKLGLTNSDAELDKGIQDICAKMKGDTTKSRIAFYYLLAEKYGKLATL
jgi:phage host-nuclease inhibitor protein Gam